VQGDVASQLRCEIDFAEHGIRRAASR
jgi:hypothetical protein